MIDGKLIAAELFRRTNKALTITGMKLDSIRELASIGWIVAAVIMVVTIGIPWAKAAFNIAVYTLVPFGQKAVSRADYSGQEDVGTGPLGVLGNIIWLVLAGWWLALGHVIVAVLLAVTIIGIPFAWAHLKLAGIALWPIGKMIVPADEAALHYARRY
jgi:uncharacterized membrane protein YccF (DUF307 family)